MDTISILKKLISIPSYVDDLKNEKKKSDYIFSLLSSKKTLIVEKQYVSKVRYNIIVRDYFTPRILLAGHIDTVTPKNKNSFTPKIIGDKLYGLGAVDMLSGVSSIISLLLNTETKGLMCLFYVDEEYNFQGMKKFLEKYNTVKPEFCLIPEPTNLSLCKEHRGLIEIEFVVKGKTAHASRPNEGINAITCSVQAVSELTKEINKFTTKELGISSCNLSKIEGGLDLDSTDTKLNLSSGSNSVADICKVRLDIRPASIELKAQVVERIFKKIVQKLKCKVVSTGIIWDLGCLIVKEQNILKITKRIQKIIPGLSYYDPKNMGYGDGQMIYEQLGIPTVYFGPGPSNMCHKDNEYVNINDLLTLDTVLKELVK